MKSMKILSALGLVVATGAAHAAAPTLKEVLDSSGITATGHVAASYSHFSTAGGSFHQFDTNHNTFTLNQAALTLGYLPAEGFGASAMFIAGDDAGAINVAGNGNTNDFAIPLAFVQYKTGAITIMAGRLLTMAGAEVVAATGNANFSRGLLFTNLEPLMHTGVRAQFAATDSVTLTLGVNNGWNVYSDNDTHKTIEAGVSFAPLKNLSFALNGYFGHDAQTYPAGFPAFSGKTTLIDVLVTYSPIDSLTLVLNYDQKKAKSVPTFGSLKSDGIALYANWSINDSWRLSGRLEQLKDDSSGGVVTGVSNEKLKSATVTLGFMPSKSMELDFEVRQDKSSKVDQFVEFNSFDSFGDPTTTNKQNEFAIQALYKF